MLQVTESHACSEHSSPWKWHVDSSCWYYRISEQNMMSPVTRSVSVPDTGSIWELQSASQPTGKVLSLGQVSWEKSMH